MKWFLFFLAFITAIDCNLAKGTLIKVNDDNWSQILSGEWMVEFYAPWCPACRNLQPVYEEFASWGEDLGIKVAQVDITHSPGLSGRFMITALPTIYHVKDGSFRQYRGSRTKEDFLSFVEDKKWEELDPLSQWQSPASIPMTVVSQFYRVSMILRNTLTIMVEDYGIPTWGGYLIFGLLTIIIGLILGLLLVCVIDCIYPPPAMRKSVDSVPVDKKSASADDEDLEDDDFVDGNDESQEEEGEENPASEGDNEGEGSRQKGKVAKESTTSEGENEPTRRRKVRRAD